MYAAFLSGSYRCLSLVVIGFHKWRSVFRLNIVERRRDGGIVSHQCEIVQLSSSASKFIVIICICVRTRSDADIGGLLPQRRADCRLAGLMKISRVCGSSFALARVCQKTSAAPRRCLRFKRPPLFRPSLKNSYIPLIAPVRCWVRELHGVHDHRQVVSESVTPNRCTLSETSLGGRGGLNLPDFFVFFSDGK